MINHHELKCKNNTFYLWNKKCCSMMNIALIHGKKFKDSLKKDAILSEEVSAL